MPSMVSLAPYPGGRVEPALAEPWRSGQALLFVALPTWNVSIFQLNLPARAHLGST